MTSRKLEDMLMKTILFIRYYFSKKLIYILLTQRFKKAHESKYQKRKSPGYISRLLKYHQHRISEIYISLEIIPNVFECLTASSVSLKALL